MSVELSFNASEWRERRAEKERALLSLAKSGDDVAATELLSFYSKFGRMNAADVQAAIEDGAREVMWSVVATTSLPNARHGAEVQPLMYFGDKSRKPGPKSTRALLELRHAFGIVLTEEDCRKALTTEYAKRGKSKESPVLDRREWPQTMNEVECELVAYVLHQFKRTPETVARHYVRESLPFFDWDAEGPVAYPADW